MENLIKLNYGPQPAVRYPSLPDPPPPTEMSTVFVSQQLSPPS